ncbi:hypothetical protein ACG7TL_007879 [Trametes sanguinea]
MSPTVLYAHPSLSPPPTFNTLDARQRARLVRSNRKLGAVLGATPQLEEQLLPAPSPVLPIGGPAGGRRSPARKTSAYAKRRQGSIFELFPLGSPSSVYDSSSSAASSVSSLSLSRTSLESTTSVDSASSLPQSKSFTRHVREKSRSKGKQAPLPTPLVLRLNAVPLPPSDPRVQPPITPDTSATLTFASSTAYNANSMLPVTPTTPLTPTVTETRRKRLAKLKRTLGENVPIELVLPLRSARQPSASSSPTTPPSATKPSSYPVTPRSSEKLQLPQATLPRPAKQERQPQKTSRRRSMSVDFQQAEPPSERRSSRVWVTGNGSWTGEWNRKDIREVQQQLRALRAR